MPNHTAANPTVDPDNIVPSRNVRKQRPTRTREGSQSSRTAVLPLVSSTLALFGLIILVTEGMLALAYGLTQPAQRPPILYSMIGLFAFVILAVTIIALVRPESLGQSPPSPPAPSPVLPNVEAIPDSEKETLIKANQSAVSGADAPPLSSDNWTIHIQELRSVLRQASRYSMPTYYLDTDLNIIDWNVGFELIFKRILPKIRCRHVNYLIAELMNCEQVFDHARDFTREIKAGRLPLVDMEPLTYSSDTYGIVEFEKIACQLTDDEANLKAWSVGLMVKQIDWTAFNSDLLPRLREHKLWSIYSVSYDAILLAFPPYLALISEVIKGVDPDANCVLDLGAGTGNVTKALLARKHRVTAIDNNQPMLEKMFAKKLEKLGRLTINKDSAETLTSFRDASFDAVVAVNVLYALSDPSRCINEVARVLKPGGVFAFSTTHSKTELDPLLNAIKINLTNSGIFKSREEHFRRVRDINKDLEVTIAKLHGRDEYEAWVQAAGLEIFYNEPSYENAVVVIHARKPL